MSDLVDLEGEVDGTSASELSSYLAKRTVAFWPYAPEEAESFAERFFFVAVYAIAGGGVGQESVDDLIQLSSCLARSRDVFIEVVRKLLPEDLIGELFYLAERYDQEYYSPYFEEAVLGAVSVFLGSLQDPCGHEQ